MVGGYNFGTGSSREQAVTSLKYKGLSVILAGSFSETYTRNAWNNGFICLEVPELVRIYLNLCCDKSHSFPSLRFLQFNILHVHVHINHSTNVTLTG